MNRDKKIYIQFLLLFLTIFLLYSRRAFTLCSTSRLPSVCLFGLVVEYILVYVDHVLFYDDGQEDFGDDDDDDDVDVAVVVVAGNGSDTVRDAMNTARSKRIEFVMGRA